MINCFADPIIKQYLEIEEPGVDTLLSNTSTGQIKQDIFEKLEEKYLKTSTELGTAKRVKSGIWAKTTGYDGYCCVVPAITIMNSASYLSDNNH